MNHINSAEFFGDVLPAPLVGPLSRWMGFDWVNELIAEFEENYDEDESVFSQALELLDVNYDVLAGDLSLIPQTGPTLLVANHPFGCMDSMILAEIATRVRPDCLFLGNYLLKTFPYLGKFIIDMDPFGGREASRKNVVSIRKAISHLRNGGLLGLFPAGEVASFQLSKFRIVEKEWPGLADQLIAKSQAEVVPIHFQGRNSMFFHTSGLVHPMLRTVQLLREMKAQQGRTFQIRIGRPISAKELQNQQKTDDRFLRNHIFRLGKMNPRKTRWQQGRDGKIRPPEELQPIVPPVPASDMQEEVEKLPEEKCFVSRGPWKVYLAEPELIPNCLREIGRLREETFRAVGEGTGKEIDLDRFDQWYLHLFLWNEDTHQIAGAYRFGPSEMILPVHGLDGLYTHSLFHFNPRFFERAGPVLETGRSFVVAGHQRSFSSLSLLWKGIGAFLVRNPQYRYAIGPVSISASYQMVSRELIMKFLNRNYHSPRNFSRLVKSNSPPEKAYPGFLSKKDLSNRLDTIVEVNGAVSAIEEDGKGIPVLFRQYLKFDTTILGFNVDNDFSGVIDGLILVDFVKTGRKIGHKLLGDGCIDAVRAYYEENRE